MVDIKYYGEVYGAQGGWLHRVDGPALTQSNGNVHWYLNGIHLSLSEWLIESNKTDKEKMLLRLQYG